MSPKTAIFHEIMQIKIPNLGCNKKKIVFVCPHTYLPGKKKMLLTQMFLSFFKKNVYMKIY